LKQETAEWNCSICKIDVHLYASIVCDGCLEWNHLKCVGLKARHWLRLPGLGNNNEKLGLPERLSAGIQFRFRNLFHGKISGNRNFIC
jgi:hypothetical protein